MLKLDSSYTIIDTLPEVLPLAANYLLRSRLLDAEVIDRILTTKGLAELDAYGATLTDKQLAKHQHALRLQINRLIGGHISPDYYMGWQRWMAHAPIINSTSTSSAQMAVRQVPDFLLDNDILDGHIYDLARAANVEL